MNDAFIAYLHDLFADFGVISTRAMFGGHGVYHRGVIIAIVIDDGLYLKTDEVTRLIVDSHDRAAFAPVAHLTVGGLRDWLLSDEATTPPSSHL